MTSTEIAPLVAPTGYTIADHLMDRLTELGVDRAFGVPGDYSADTTAHPGRFTLVQAVVPRDDVPVLLSALTAVLGRSARSAS